MMQEVTKYPNGTFSWVDLTTTDPDAAKTFYSSLFGWEIVDVPVGNGNVYTMFQLEGRDVAALSGMNPAQQAEGIPPYWTSYVSVDNLDETTANVTALGGSLLARPCDVFDAGRMALVQDPIGANFALWEAKKHIGAKLVNMPNALVWNELATRETEKATAFYTALFGWTSRVDQSLLGTAYITLINNDRLAAGMLQMTDAWGDIPPHWMVYFAVEDCAATVEKVKSLGGSIALPPTEVPQVGTFSVIQDPQGGTFAVMSYVVDFDPPPSA